MLVLLTALLAASSVPVAGDFDHDGRADRAQIEAGAGGRLQLVVHHASGGRSVIDPAVEDAAAMIVQRAAPGQVASACADERASRSACPQDALPTGEVLLFGKRGGPMAVALWTGRSFETVWIAN